MYIDMSDKRFNPSDNDRRKANEKLYRLYRAKDMRDYDGSTAKVECDIDGEHGIFKERRSLRSKDHIMEQVAYELSKFMRVPCCKASCRKVYSTQAKIIGVTSSKNVIYGAFSRFECGAENMTTFGSLFDGSIMRGNIVDPEMILKVLTKRYGRMSEITVTFFRYLIFDYIMGQLDRHEENIALTITNGTVQMYPLFDNGLCLGAYEDNDSAIVALENGFYSSRMGSNADIIQTIAKFRTDNLKNVDIRKVIRYDLVNIDNVLRAISISDKYNQMNTDRRQAEAKFMYRQAFDIHKINLGGE
jgi:hypothetical protein